MGKRREGGGTKSYAAPLQDYHSARRLEYFFSDLDATESAMLEQLQIGQSWPSCRYTWRIS